MVLGKGMDSKLSVENSLLNEILSLDEEAAFHAPTIAALDNSCTCTCFGYSNSCNCGCQQSCDIGDTKEDHQPIKVSINCPKCMIKLGFRVAPSQHKLKGSANIAPDDGSGDNEDTFGSLSLCKGAVRNTQDMSYTVLKGSVSLPDTKIFATTCDRRKVRSRGSKPEVDKIPLKNGKTYDCLHTSQGNERFAHPVLAQSTFNMSCAPPPPVSITSHSPINRGIRVPKTSHSNHRHCSFADPIVSNIDSNSSLKSPQLNDSEEDLSYPYLQISNGRGLRFVDNSEHLFGRDSLLGSGIDLEDGVPLYESSSASSCEDPRDSAEVKMRRLENNEKVKSSLSHNAPVESKAPDSGLPASNSQANQAGYQMPGDHLSAEEINALKSDIPEYRQDLYKDCFTLFVEQWFGKRGN